MRNCIYIIAYLIINLLKPMHIVDVLFCILCNFRHIFQSSNGILTCGRLAWKHNGWRSIINSIGHIWNFSSRRTRIINHRFEHFRCCDNKLAQHTTFLNEILLDRRHFDIWNLNTQITSCDHYAIRNITYLINMIYTWSIFNLSDNINVFTAVFVKKCTK